MKKDTYVVAAVWLLLLAALSATLADAQTVPALINYQGKLVNSNGLPVSTGDYQLRFRIYDTVTNGNLIWGPQVFNGQTGPGYGPLVSVVQGWFNVILGPIDTNGAVISEAFSNSDRYLEIQIGTNAPFTSRQQVLSAPYALRAESAQTALHADRALLADTAMAASRADSASVASISQNGVPVGAIIPFAGANPPAGFLLCDGSEVGRSGFADLFAAIGTAHGSGNGSTTFNLPDLRGVFLRGVDGRRGLDPESGGRSAWNGGNSGNNIGSYQADGFQDHLHSTDLNPRNDWPTSGSGATRVVSTEGSGGRLTQGAMSGRVCSETRPKNVYVNYIIKF